MICIILLKQNYTFSGDTHKFKHPPYPPSRTFSDSLKRITWRLNLTSLSTASKVLSQTAAVLHIHMHMQRLTAYMFHARTHTAMHPHPSGLPGKGAQIILSGLPAVQSTYMGQSREGVCVCVRVWRGWRGALWQLACQ